MHLTMFIVILLGRRFAYCFLIKTLETVCPRHFHQTALKIIRYVLHAERHQICSLRTGIVWLFSLQIFIFRWHSTCTGIFMHKNVSQATICGRILVLSIDCVCDNIWSTHRAISTDNFRIGRVTVFQWDTIAFMLHQSNYNSSRNRCAARRLQQSLQTSGIYVTVECILRRIYTVLFCTKLLVSTTDRTSIDFPYLSIRLRVAVNSIRSSVSLSSFSIFQILRFILGDAAFGLFGAGRIHDVHDVLLSGQLLRCHAYGIVAFGEMGSDWVAIVRTAGNCVVEIGGVAAGSICKTFWRIVQGVRYCDNSHTGQRHSQAVLREYYLSLFDLIEIECIITCFHSLCGLHPMQMFFQNPANIYLILSIVQSIIVLLQVIILFMVVEWHNIISLSYLLLFNYYILFKIVRDFVITNRMYMHYL